MQFKLIDNYIKGFVRIEVEGYYIERFINNCMTKGIFLWGITRKRGTIIQAKININDFKQAVTIAKKHGCKIKIKRKSGVPFLIKRYKKRRLFFILLVVVFIVIFGISKFIWNIDITGNEKINGQEIIEIARENGLKVGTLKSSINVEEIINKIRLARNDLAWIGIEIKGTNAIIKVVEAEEKPEIVDENSFTNIVASKDGEITSISAQNGTILTPKGTQVKKGDVLIAGYMEGKYTDRYYVNSNGEVKAKVIYSGTEKISKKETKKQETGNINKKYAIKFNNFKINFYKKLSKFKNYDTIYESKKIKIFSNFYLPIEFIQYTNYEVEEVELTHTEDEAKELGKQAIEERLEKLIEGDIIDKTIEMIDNGTYYEVKMIYTSIENIGTKEEIKF